MEFGSSILTIFKLKAENEALNAKVAALGEEKNVSENKIESLEEQLEKSDAIRRKLQIELSVKEHSDRLEEQNLVSQLNAENERNQNIY